MNKLCDYFRMEINRWNYKRPFCSVQCRWSYNRYEYGVNRLKSNLKNKIFTKAESVRVRKYHNCNQSEKLMLEILTC